MYTRKAKTSYFFYTSCLSELPVQPACRLFFRLVHSFCIIGRAISNEDLIHIKMSHISVAFVRNSL